MSEWEVSGACNSLHQLRASSHADHSRRSSASARCMALSENLETAARASNLAPLAATRIRTQARDKSSAVITEIRKWISWLCHCSEGGHDDSGIAFTWVVANRNRPDGCDR